MLLPPTTRPRDLRQPGLQTGFVTRATRNVQRLAKHPHTLANRRRPYGGSEAPTTVGPAPGQAERAGLGGARSPLRNRPRSPAARRQSPLTPGQAQTDPALPPGTPSAPAAGGNGKACSPAPAVTTHPPQPGRRAASHAAAGAFPQGLARRSRVRREFGSRARQV